MFKPDFLFNSVSDITTEFLRYNNIMGLVLDIDNTLAIPDKRQIPENISLWIKEMKSAGISMVLLSNNSEERIKDFADDVQMPFVSRGMKPFKKGYIKATQLIRTELSLCAVVGDQIFTDIVGGNRCGMKTILTEPFTVDQTSFIKFKRILEKIILNRYRKENER